MTIVPSNHNTKKIPQPIAGNELQKQILQKTSNKEESIQHAPQVKENKEVKGKLPVKNGSAKFDQAFMGKMEKWNDSDSGGVSTLSFMIFLMKAMIEAAQQERSIRHQARINEYETSMKSVEKQKEAARLQFVAGIVSASAQIAAGSASIAGSAQASKVQKKYDTQIMKQFKLNKPAKVKNNKVSPAPEQNVKPADVAKRVKAKPKTEAERMEQTAQDIQKFNAGADYREAQYRATNEVRSILQKAEGASMLTRSIGEAGSAGAKWMSDLQTAEAKALDALAKYIGQEGSENNELYQSFKSSSDNVRNIFKSISDSTHSTMSHISRA